jgi:hypothetical protein
MKISSTTIAAMLCTAPFWLQENVAAQGVLPAAASSVSPQPVSGAMPSDRRGDSIALNEIQAIAKDAYIYAYPMLFNYKTLYQQALDPQSPAYVGGFGKIRNYAQLYGPSNVEIVTPNNDTPYSWAWLDLRREPWVLSVPEVPKNRYYVFQGVDLFTYNFAYLGSRATGNHAGHYLFAGPGWNGKLPPGIDKVFKSDTELMMLFGRTALDGPTDVKNVQRIQQQYRLTPLSEFEHTAPPAAVPAINFPRWDEARATSPDFISYLDFLLQFTQPVDPSERDLMQRFAKIGIEPGRTSTFTEPGTATRAAIALGVTEAKQAMATVQKNTRDSLDLFGSRADLKNNYMARAAGAAIGIYGNTKTEAVYFGYKTDANQQALLGEHAYKLHFTAQDLPPARFFWSMTLYDLPGRHLVANPIKRYSIGDRTKSLQYHADGSLDIYIQHQEPEKSKRANWLPAPNGPYYLIMRIYGPRPAVFDGRWHLVKPEKIPAQ